MQLAPSTSPPTALSPRRGGVLPRSTVRLTRFATLARVSLAVFLSSGFFLSAVGQAVPNAAAQTTISFSTAEAVPADAFAYVVTTTDDQSEQWRLADTLLDRAGVGAVLEEEMAKELTDENGQPLPLDAFLGGEVAVVVDDSALENAVAESMGTGDFGSMMESMGMATPEAASGEPEAQGFALVIDARAPDTAWAGIQDAMADSGEIVESDYEGTTISYAASSSIDEPGTAAARVGDLILVSMAPVDLQPVIDTLDGRTPSITTVPEFSDVQDALPDDFLMFAFVNGGAVSATDLGPLQASFGQYQTDSFSGVTLAADEPGFRMESVAIPAAGGTLPEQPDNFESELVDVAPGNSLLFFSSADLGPSGVLDALGAFFIGMAMGMTAPGATPEAGASPEAAIAAQYEAAAAMIGINLQTEIFQRLVGEYGAWVTADMATQHVSALFASGLDDPERVSNALTQLSFLIQGATGGETPLTTRQVGEGQVYVLDLGDEVGSTLEFGVVGDQLVIGSGDAVDRLAGSPEDALSGNTQYQAVMDTLPVEHNSQVYVDLAQAIPLAEMAEESAPMGMGMEDGQDASESCANYDSQEAAQAAYDAAEPDTFDLDQDFDGQVCEDFFASADGSAETTDASATEDPLANVDYSAIKAFASVSYEEDGAAYTSSILYISE